MIMSVASAVADKGDDTAYGVKDRQPRKRVFAAWSRTGKRSSR